MTDQQKYELFTKVRAAEILVKINHLSSSISAWMELNEQLEDLNIEKEYKEWLKRLDAS